MLKAVFWVLDRNDSKCDGKNTTLEKVGLSVPRSSFTLAKRVNDLDAGKGLLVIGNDNALVGFCDRRDDCVECASPKRRRTWRRVRIDIATGTARARLGCEGNDQQEDRKCTVLEWQQR